MSSTLHDVSYGPYLKARSVTAADAAQQGDSTMSKGVPCPHCKKEISKAYAVKALVVLAKSEGQDLSDELAALAGELDESDVEKGRKGVDVGNKVDSHRGPHKPGKMHSSSRGSGTGQAVQRENSPANKIAQGGGMRKSLFPAIIGQPQLVEYVTGNDEEVSKGIQDGTHHVPPARNLQMEQAEAQGV
jgi:hypothetical protein